MATLEVEVVYALPGSEDAVTVRLPAGATVGDAVAASGILTRHPEIAATSQQFGIHGERAEPGAAVFDGDRVEIYRPLVLDPKEARRKRALRKPLSRRAG
jgi:putative ubiquitin-RnfH superfamily antitoxin RatB of RatAB toxin-antitoxin module